MKSHLKILICALSLSAAFAVVSNVTTLLLSYARPPISYGFAEYYTIVLAAEIASYVINPVIMFVVFYLVGRGLNLPNILKSSLISLAAGCLIGYLVVFVPILLLTEVFLPNSLAPTLAGVLLLTFFALYTGAIRVFSSIFFVALAALALAYMRKSRITLESSSPSSTAPSAIG